MTKKTKRVRGAKGNGKQDERKKRAGGHREEDRSYICGNVINLALISDSSVVLYDRKIPPSQA